MLLAMKTSVEVLNGVEILFQDLFERCYDIKLQPISDSELLQLKKEFEKAYECSGNLDLNLVLIRFYNKNLNKI